MAERRYRYPAGIRAMHWLVAALVAIAYLTGESAERVSAGAVNWHVLAGLALVLLFVPRLLAHLWLRTQPPADSGAASRWVARSVHLSLLLFILVEPILGLLTVWAGGHALPIPLTPWALPALLPLDEGWEHTLGDLHKGLGNAFYAVIALHVLASLWHHFVRRDDVLRRML